MIDNKEYFIWLRDDNQEMENCYAAYIIRVYGQENRDLIWDLFKSGWAEEFFDDEELQKKYIDFENYFITKLETQYNIDFQVIDHDTLAFSGI